MSVAASLDADIILKAEKVGKVYPGTVALQEVDFEVRRGAVNVLVGENGAGKSTLMMTICGNPRAHEGSIAFAGCDITHLPTHEIAQLRLAQSPEGRRIFPRMTVLENLQMGAITAGGAQFAGDLYRVLALFPRLQQRLAQRGGTLSGGEQQMLAIARALIREPKILLLDEPFEGLAPIIVHDLLATCKTLAEAGQTILIVEQNISATMTLADRIYLMHNGHIVDSLSAQTVRAQPELLHRRLGV